MLFEQVTKVNICPTPENYDSIIYEAKIIVDQTNIYWSPECVWDLHNKDKDTLVKHIIELLKLTASLSSDQHIFNFFNCFVL